MVLTGSDNVFAFDAGHVATASGKIFYCHEEHGICIVSQVILTNPYVAEIHLRPLKQKSLRVDNFRRLDFAEFHRLGFTVDFIMTDGRTPKRPPLRRKPIAWSTPGIPVGDELSMAVESLNQLGYEEAPEFEYEEIEDDDDDDPTYHHEDEMPVSAPTKRQTSGTKRPQRKARGGLYRCKQCGRQFTAQLKLSEHVKLHGGFKSFNCELCHRAFSWKSDLNKHYMKQHTLQEKSMLAPDPTHRFECEICGFRAAREKDLILHQRLRKHGNPRPAYPKYVPRVGSVRRGSMAGIKREPRCRRCDQLFATREELTQHRRAVHTKEDPKHQCEHCDFKSEIRDQYREHLLKQHNINTVADVGLTQEPYKCEQCDVNFDHYRRMERHIRTKHSGQPVSCLWWGERVVRKITGHQCEICELVVNTKFKLNTHMRTHTDERPYPCDVCGKAFRYPQDRIKHMIVHQARTLPCDQCDKSYRNDKDLEQHKKVVHDRINVRPPKKCPHCKETFAELRSHLLRVHTDPSEWPHKCSYCDFRAVIPSELQQHTVKKHTFDWPHRCQLCNFGCTDRKQMVKHQAKHDEGKALPLRDEQGNIKVVQDTSNDTSGIGVTGVSLLDDALSNDLDETNSGEQSEGQQTLYNAELIKDVAKAINEQSMARGDLIDLFGITKRAYYAVQIQLQKLKKNNPEWTNDQLYDAIDPPARPKTIIDRFSQEDLDCAMADIKDGNLSTSEAAVIYGIPRATLIKMRHKRGIADSKDGRGKKKQKEETEVITEVIDEALNDIREGKLTTIEAAEMYEVPRYKLIELRKERDIEDIKSAANPSTSGSSPGSKRKAEDEVYEPIRRSTRLRGKQRTNWGSIGAQIDQEEDENEEEEEEDEN